MYDFYKIFRFCKFIFAVKVKTDSAETTTETTGRVAMKKEARKTKTIGAEIETITDRTLIQNRTTIGVVARMTGKIATTLTIPKNGVMRRRVRLNLSGNEKKIGLVVEMEEGRTLPPEGKTTGVVVKKMTQGNLIKEITGVIEKTIRKASILKMTLGEIQKVNQRIVGVIKKGEVGTILKRIGTGTFMSRTRVPN